MKVLAPLAALAIVLSGCAQDGAGGEGGALVEDPACAFDGTACTGNLTAPRVDARATLGLLRDFAHGNPGRVMGSPALDDARDDLEGRFQAMGLEVLRHTFPEGGENIVAVKPGLDPDAWIVVGAHYDITEAAVYGAYDDGSGTAMVLALAAAYAQVTTNRSLVFVAFDQEEQGLLGSAHFVDDAFAGVFGPDVHVDGMVDLDMVGITWPHPAHLIVWQNSGFLRQRITSLARDVGMPDSHLEFRESRAGSSDGVSFISAGIPTAYMFSDWDQYFLPGDQPMPFVSGYVGSYPWWHKADSYETMVASAGGEDRLEAGFQNTLDIVSPLVAYMASGQFMPDAEISP